MVPTYGFLWEDGRATPISMGAICRGTGHRFEKETTGYAKNIKFENNIRKDRLNPSQSRKSSFPTA